MALYSIGDLIKEFRSRTGATREFLCDETISPETIYRIEIGEHIPQYRVIKTLCARMDIPIPMNLVSLTEDEYHRYTMHERLLAKLNKGNTDSVFEKELDAFYATSNEDSNVFDEQFYLLCKASAAENSGRTKEARSFYTQAVKLTIPEFGPAFTFSEHVIFTEQEIHLIHGIARLDWRDGLRETALHYAKECLAYFDRGMVDALRKNALYLPLLASYSEWLVPFQRYKEALSYAQQGIALCVENDSMRFLKIFSAVQGACLAASGNTAAAEESFALSHACY